MSGEMNRYRGPEIPQEPEYIAVNEQQQAINQSLEQARTFQRPSAMP
jgi:hypothetical protein